MPTVSVRVVDVYPYRLRGDRVELLVLRRSAGRVYAGEWRIVGGKIEAGEAAWQAAVRETREEVGRAPTRLWAVGSVNTFYEWQHDRVDLIPAFGAELNADPVLDAEHDAWEWLSAGDAAERMAWSEQRRLAVLVAETLARGIPDALMIPPSEWPASADDA